MRSIAHPLTELRMKLSVVNFSHSDKQFFMLPALKILACALSLLKLLLLVQGKESEELTPSVLIFFTLPVSSVCENPTYCCWIFPCRSPICSCYYCSICMSGCFWTLSYGYGDVAFSCSCLTTGPCYHWRSSNSYQLL